ncbi:MAG: Flp/Fap pilin component [Acidimicrobiales bacterium]|nr:Flp/Fap pilin component [Acidimicrobiales bacterium]
MHPHRNAQSRERTDRREDGASLVEYALLLALIAVVCFSAVSFFGSQSQGGFGKSKECISAAYDSTALPASCQH